MGRNLGRGLLATALLAAGCGSSHPRADTGSTGPAGSRYLQDIRPAQQALTRLQQQLTAAGDNLTTTEAGAITGPASTALNQLAVTLASQTWPPDVPVANLEAKLANLAAALTAFGHADLTTAADTEHAVQTAAQAEQNAAQTVRTALRLPPIATGNTL